MLLASAICSCSEKQPETTEPMITKTEIQVENGKLTPEIMHRLGKVGDPQLSPNYGKILYGVSYTSIEQNKGNRELFDAGVRYSVEDFCIVRRKLRIAHLT